MAANKSKITNKANLVEALKSILISDSVSTQEEIRQRLQEAGFEINQSKISRLLHRIGAIKTTNEHKQIIYSLSREPVPTTSQNILSQLIISMTYNESLIVVQTNPGSASYIGRLLDHNREALTILGTVAGDDTIFIAPHSIKKIKETLQIINDFLSSQP